MAYSINRVFGLLTTKKLLWYSSKWRTNSTDLLKCMLERRLLKHIFPSESTIDYTGAPCAYAGFDPTADSLHVGNLLVILSLMHWRAAGYETIVVIGDATAKIGDPSGHKDDRNVIVSDIIDQNAEAIEKNVNELFQNHELHIFSRKEQKQKSLGTLRILKNGDWYRNQSIVDFFSQAGRHIRVGDMLSRTSVRTRMESGVGINFSEFSYQVFQSYDWLHLLKTYNCRFQFGGSDQLGNVTSGYNLISSALNQQVYGALLPLVQSETGDKFGKTAGNAVYLSPHRTSSFDFYQFFMRIADADVSSYLNIFTFLTAEEIENAIEQHRKNPDHRNAQKILAREVTLLVHGESGLKLAETATKILFHSDLKSLSRLKKDELSQVFPSSTLSYLSFEPNSSLIDVTLKVGCFLKKGDALRVIKSGGVSVNFEKVLQPETILNRESHILENGITHIRIGKKTYYVIVWK